jgi:hypothetical protein
MLFAFAAATTAAAAALATTTTTTTTTTAAPAMYLGAAASATMYLGAATAAAGMAHAPGSALAAAGMSSAPIMPAVPAAPAKTDAPAIVAPIPARPIPTIFVPAIIVTEPDELHALDHIQAVGRRSDRSGRDDRGRADARAHDRCAGKEYGCGRNGDHESTLDDLPEFGLRTCLFLPL